MRLSKALKDKIMDVRLRDKLIAEGKVTPNQVEEYMKSLEDDHDAYIYTEEDEGEVKE